jgi:uncharacterized protein (TIRG00374 family)
LKKKILSWVLRLAITIGLFVLLFTRTVDPREALAELEGISAGWLLAALVVQATAILSSVVRWNILLRGQGLYVSRGHLMRTFLIGRFFGTFLPGTIGLDAYRTYDIASRTKAVAKSLAVIVVEKIIGFFALSTLVLVTLPAGLRFLPTQVLVFVFLAFCVPVSISFVLLLEPNLVLRLLDLPFPFKRRIEGKLRQAANALAAYRSRRRSLLLAVLCGIVVHLSTTLMYYCTARAIGAPVSLYDVLFAGPLMIVAMVGLPSIGGVGVREFTMVGLLARIGVPESSAFTLGHLGFWVGLALSLIGGVLYMARPASYRPVIHMAQLGEQDARVPQSQTPVRRNGIPTAKVANDSPVSECHSDLPAASPLSAKGSN